VFAGKCSWRISFTAGLYPFKREGEILLECLLRRWTKKNKRFSLCGAGLPAKRLSTTFDSVTLYGNDPHVRPDIYGKSECWSFNLLFG
jgi:methylmalonyl-CoA mutase